MSDRTDVAQNLALAAVAGLVALVLAGVLGLAVLSRARSAPAPAPVSAAAAPGANAPAAEPAVLPVVSLVFDAGSAVLPAGAGEALARIADAARAQAGTTVVIAAHPDADGDAARQGDLARARSEAVRHALEADGVSPSQLLTVAPGRTAGGADLRLAGRVDLSLQ